MNATREEMVAEALRRMKMIKLFSPAVRDFKEDGKLNKSVGGMLYWLDDNDAERISEFEKEHGCVAYHVIETNTSFGMLQSVLYVSPHKEEWPADRADLANMMPFVYVFNLDDEWCSEFGFIGVAERYGGLVRTS